MDAKRKNLYKCILWVLITLTVGVIWSLSLRSAYASSQQSNVVALPVISTTGAAGDWFDILLYMVRKMAHFAEFWWLGLLWGLYGRLRWYPLMWTYGLAVAVIDELLQYFAPGRAPGFWDVVIDYCGFFCGFALVMAVVEYLRRKKERKNPK